ncbi:MAG: hypothetical protein Cons2KO_10640 [Congregibacter sp.]
MMRLLHKVLSELRRRGVIRPVVAYTVVAWAIVQVANEVGPIFAVPEWINTLVAVVGLMGFPVALYIAWFFDFSEGSLTRTPDALSAAMKPLTLWHWLGLGVIVAGASSSGFYVFEEIRDRIARGESGLERLDIAETIAVIPFKDASPAQDQAYFATGLTEELTSLIGRVDGIRVSASSAAFRLSEAGLDAVAIGRELDVAAVLTGSIQVTGDRVRVRTELIDTQDASVLWSDRFTRKLSEIFAVEADIARSITNLLQDRYLAAEEMDLVSATASTDAYVLYLQGKAAVRKRTAESVKTARKLFEESVGLDPEYAVAHVGVAETVWRLAEGVENFGELDREVAATLSRKSLERALVINPEIPEAYANLGRIEALENNHIEALEHFSKALQLNPSYADVYLWRYLSESSLERYADAYASLERALELDPTSPAILHNLGFENSLRGNFEKARRYFDTLLAKEPDNPLGYRGLAQAAFREGQLALSLQQWGEALRLAPETPLYKQSYRDVLYGLRMLEAYKPLALEAGEDVNVLLLQGDYETLHDEMDFAVKSYPDDPWVMFEAAWYRGLAGDISEYTELLVAADAFLTDEDRFAMPFCSPGVEVAHAHLLSGNSEQANRYVDECEDRLKAARTGIYVDSELDYLAVRLAALQNNTELATHELETAFAHGWREWWSKQDPVLHSVKSDAAVKMQFDRIEKALEEQVVLARAYLEAHAAP